MSAAAQWLGYAFLSLGGLYFLAMIAAYVMDYIWKRINDGANMAWMLRAFKHYETIEPRPTKESTP